MKSIIFDKNIVETTCFVYKELIEIIIELEFHESSTITLTVKDQFKYLWEQLN